MYKHSFKVFIHQKCIQEGKNACKYQKPHGPFLIRNSSEEQFTPSRKEKLVDVESKPLISTDVQHLGNNMNTGDKEIIAIPHEVTAEDRSKSIR